LHRVKGVIISKRKEWIMTRLGWMVALVALAPMGALAQQDGYPLFERLDADGSQTLTLEEFQAGAAAMPRQREGADPARMFARLDADGDGVVTVSEWAVVASAVRERGGPGAMEPGARADRVFDQLDSNGDGAISREEFRAGATQMRERRENGARPFGRQN
jgi:Ca2+-binding EF-hand superfamily protein